MQQVVNHLTNAIKAIEARKKEIQSGVVRDGQVGLTGEEVTILTDLTEKLRQIRDLSIVKHTLIHGVASASKAFSLTSSRISQILKANR